jgi:hypothetical protein
MWKNYVFMDAAGDGGDPGGGAASGDAGAAAAAGAAGGNEGAGSAAAGSEAGSASVLAAGAEGGAITIPEKYQVKKEDGSIDIEASSLKLAEAYGHLEKRLGSGDAPPKTAEDYQIAVPDTLKDVWNPKEDPLLGEFLKNAHAAGMNQKQVDLAMQTYLDVVPKLLEGSKTLSSEECTAELQKAWNTPEQYKAEVRKAYQAAMAYGDTDAEAILKDYGNDPRVIRLLARVGGEMGEDRSVTPPGGGIPQGQTAESLMMSEAYNNPKHPEHAAVSRQVAAHFEAMAKQAAKSGNVPVM